VADISDAMRKYLEQQASKDRPEQTPTTGEPATDDDMKTLPPTAASKPPAAPSPKHYSERMVVHWDQGGNLAEEYRTLRSQLLAACGDGRICLAVASARPGEGKSVTAMNLAGVLAERRQRSTVLVDGHLVSRALGRYLAASKAPGLADVLSGAADLEACIQPTAYDNVSLLPAGGTGQAAQSLLEGPQLAELVRQLQSKFDHVIIDTPAIYGTSGASGAALLSAAAGRAILVVRMCSTRRESVDRSIRLLKAAGVDVAGVVLADRKFFIPSMLYRHL